MVFWMLFNIVYAVMYVFAIWFGYLNFSNKVQKSKTKYINLSIVWTHIVAREYEINLKKKIVLASAIVQSTCELLTGNSAAA